MQLVIVGSLMEWFILLDGVVRPSQQPFTCNEAPPVDLGVFRFHGDNYCPSHPDIIMFPT